MSARCEEEHTPRTLPPRTRLARRTEFEAVFREGLKAVSESCVLYGRRQLLGESRLGMAVSRRFGRRAVRRNRARRLIREAFRLRRHEWPSGWDWVVIPRVEGFPDHQDQVATALALVIRKLERKAERKNT